VATRVLVVDDDRAIRSLLQAALTDEGHEVRAAVNGAEALCVLRTYPAEVILLDVEMPVMDGVTFAERYRQTCSAHDEAPIIVITAGGDAPARARQLAAAAFADKPFDLGELSRSVARVALHRHGHQVLR
jgi:CheY-like chemotaxis protein